MTKNIYDQVTNFNENEECEVAMMMPFLQEEFLNWLMTTRKLQKDSAQKHLRDFIYAYETLYEQVGLDLYRLLHAFLTDIPSDTNNNLTREIAPELVYVYLTALQEEMVKNPNVYKKTHLLAMNEYHAFIIDVSESSDKKLLKEKALPLPDEAEFLSWLETEYKMDYENAKKIASSVKRMDLILPSLVSEPMTFLDVLRALPAGSKRDHYVQLIRSKQNEISCNANCSYKTIQNGLANVAYYVLFLRSCE